MTTADLIVQTLNVHATSNARGVATWLTESIKFHTVDLVALQELTPRHIRVLDDIPGYTLLVDRSEPGSGETGWLVRNAFVGSLGDADAKRMTRDGWFGWQVGKQHTPRYMAVTHLSKPFLAAGVVHTPPGVDCTPHGLTGPRDRRRAWRQYMSSLRRWARARQRYILIGDWNERAAVKAKWSPRWLAKQVGARLFATGTLDFVMHKGMRVVDSKRVETPEDVDHDSHIFWMDFR